jgi:ubiquinone/menaquinone biosynthesis C-methylase UbiE
MPLSAQEARRVYDRIGRLQDTQAFYEEVAIDRMIALSDLAGAGAVFELGCGTGRLARRLLAGHLPRETTYLATDVSTRMVQIAAERLRPWARRASVSLLDPATRSLPGQSAAFDRFIATYVFDLLEEGDARWLLDEASRLLGPDGRLCAVGITPGPRGPSRLVMRAWDAIATRFPRVVGGCRPIDLRRLLDPGHWVIDASEIVTRWGVSSQVVVARCGNPR